MKDTEAPQDTRSFARAIDGAYGTVVFGNGISAIEGTVTLAGSGYVLIEEAAPTGTVTAVPVSSIVYFRFTDE